MSSAINPFAIFSTLESQIGRSALSTAMLTYLSSVPVDAPAPVAVPLVTPAKGAKNSSPSAPPAPVKAKRAKKERSSDAAPKPPSEWLTFSGRVRGVIEKITGGKVPGKVWMQTASSLRDAGLMPSATDEQVTAAYQAYLAAPPEHSKAYTRGLSKAAKKAKAEASSTTSSEPSVASVAKALDFSAPAPAPAPSVEGKKRQGRKKLADMTAEERAAHEAKKATKRASKTPPLPSSPKASAEDELLDFAAFTWNGLSLLKNPRGDCLTEDMEWFGHWNSETKTVDTAATQPSDLNL